MNYDVNLKDYSLNRLFYDVAVLLSEHTGLGVDDVLSNLRDTPSLDLGDVSFPCFMLSKVFKKSPVDIANDLSSVIKADFVSDVKAVNGYLNIYFDRAFFYSVFLKDFSNGSFGSNQFGFGKKIIIEMSSPNIAKAFGIGHLRSTIIGQSLNNIYKFCGYETIKFNYLGDWGTQFGKLIRGYELYGDEVLLESDPINHLQEVYVKLNQNITKEDEDRSKEIFKLMESGDKDILSLWDKIRKVSISEFEKVYELLGVSFDVVSGESYQNKNSLKAISVLFDKGIAKESDGAAIIDYGDELGVGILRKSDGTTIYLSRDIAAAIERKEVYDFDEMIYEVGSEQELHFKQVFKALELLGFDWSCNLRHVSHGLYLGKDGKKLSTRQGSSLKMKDIWNEVEVKVSDELNKRNSFSDDRLLKITRSAVIYGDLKNYRNTSVIFDSDKITSMEGDTGPYLLYSYARSRSILRKSNKSFSDSLISDLDEFEYSLVKSFSKFPFVILDAKVKDDPSIIANYSMKLAQEFNSFYSKCQVIGHEKEEFRLFLIKSYGDILKSSLYLIGIDTIEEM